MKKEEICFSCGGTGIYKHEDIDLEPKYGAQERQEKEDLRCGTCQREENFGDCFRGYCINYKRIAEPERIEELESIDTLNLFPVIDKINQIIRKLNNL